MRGFKKDIQDTAAAKFRDRGGRHRKCRSFISLPKVTPHTNGVPQPHLILYGVDKGPIRAQIFERSRKANGVARCWNCGVMVAETPEEEIPQKGEWDHAENAPALRCDCPENGRVACAGCHRGPDGTHPGRG